jgi:hypothetical protein
VAARCKIAGVWCEDGRMDTDRCRPPADTVFIGPRGTIDTDRSTVRGAVDIKVSHVCRSSHRCRNLRTIGITREGIDTRVDSGVRDGGTTADVNSLFCRGGTCKQQAEKDYDCIKFHSDQYNREYVILFCFARTSREGLSSGILPRSCCTAGCEDTHRCSHGIMEGQRKKAYPDCIFRIPGIAHRIHSG